MTQLESKLDEAAHAEMMRSAAADYPKVCEEISALVARAKAIVGAVDPVDLLRRGYWQAAFALAEVGPEESRHGHEQHLAREMIWYVQKLACAVARSAGQPRATKEQYSELAGLVSQMLVLFNTRYFFARTAWLRQREDYDEERDELGVLVEWMWVFTQGDRYHAHISEYLRALLGPHDEALQRVFGVSADQIVDGVDLIIQTLVFGAQKAHDVIRSEQAALPSPEDAGPDFDFGLWLKERGAREPGSEVQLAIDRLMGFGLFDVEKITGWPPALGEALSLEVGTDRGFVSHQERGGWPTQSSECMTHPFIAARSRSWVFNLQHCTDVFYRAIERAVLAADPEYRERWNRIQARTCEEIAIELIVRVLEGAQIYRSVHYKVTDPESGEEQWAECDAVLAFDRHLLILEAKGGGLPTTSPAVQAQAHVNAMKALVRDPIKQARRFAKELGSQGTLDIYDENHTLIGQVSGEVETVSVLCVTIEQLTDLAPQVEHLTPVGLESDDVPAMAVSLDDLRVVVEVLHSPIEFLHFLRQRLAAFSSPGVRMLDELDHLGAYLEHNDYSAFAESFKDAPPIGWDGYRDSLDRYFHERFNAVAGAAPPRQIMPEMMRQILDALDRERAPGFTSAGMMLLDGSGDARRTLAEGIAECANLQGLQRRPRPLSTQGGWPITVFINGPGGIQLKLDDARIQACANLQLSGDRKRLALVVDLSPEGEVDRAQAEIVTKETAATLGDEAIREYRFKLFRSRRRREK